MSISANSPQQIKHNFDAVRARIRAAAQEIARPLDDLHLIAVSKTKPSEAIQAALDAGQQAFGENYAQELATKAAIDFDGQPEWHFIGPLQSNKTQLVANAAHWVHSLDRAKIARRLSAQRAATLPNLQCCIQVNISADANKSGVMPDQVQELAQQISALPRLTLRGLMCIPNRVDHEAFARMNRLFTQLKPEFAWDCLSMGMSQDFEQAIQHGATHLRVGTALFGGRN